MKRVGVREFRDHATQYLAGDSVLAVERHGQPIGFYIPVNATANEERQQVVAQFGKAVERLLAESGMTEDELAEALDFSRPSPSPDEPALATAYASGRRR